MKAPKSHEGAFFVRHIPCPECGSRDNNSLYSDNHQYCFGCNTYVPGEGSQSETRRRRKLAGLLEGEVSALLSRKITEDTCRKFGYLKGKHKGHTVQIAPYYDDDGNLVAQKIRGADKKFRVVGDMTDALPFGAHVWPKTGKMIVVTEGEIDALSMSQVQGNKWPVVSIGCGADKPEDKDGNPLPMTKIRKYFAKHRDYFSKFETVVLMFDSDAQGRASAKAAAEVIGAGRAKIASLPLHDANDMLKAGRVEELVQAMWRAEAYRMDGIVSLAEIREKVMKEAERGLAFSLPTLSALTYGRRYGETWVAGAGVSAGKTDLLLQEAAYAVTHHKEPVGLFFLEAAPQDIGRRLAGKVAGKPFHVPDAGWTQEELEDALGKLKEVYLYDSYGVTDWDAIAETMRYLRHAHNVRYFVIDNLTALTATAEDERRETERVMAEVASLNQELGSFAWVVSHLNTPEGTPHENGGKVYLRHLKGSRAIAAWAHFVIGIERDQQAEDETERRTSTIRMLKDRVTGRATGRTFRARYDFQTGLLGEVDEELETTTKTKTTPEGFTPQDDDEEDEEEEF